jgi:hypothetical protein
MTDHYLDQVPRKAHVLWARLLSVIGSLLSGAVLVSLLTALLGHSSKPVQPAAIIIWGLFFFGCVWVFAKSFFSTPRRPSALAVKVFSVLASVVSLLLGALALFAFVSKAGA